MAQPNKGQSRVIHIGPSILSADFGRLAEEAAAAEAAGADFLHVDVMDGEFVPNITIGPMAVEALRRAVRIPLDVHLMIARPERYIERFGEAGSDWITVHAEATPHLHRALEMIRGLQKKAGVSLNPATPLCMVESVMDLVDLLLIMTVNPGFGGQAFLSSQIPKIARAAEMCAQAKHDVWLEVDGGINLENIGSVAQAGARWFVAGSAVYRSKDYRKAIRSMREAAQQAL